MKIQTFLATICLAASTAAAQNNTSCPSLTASPLPVPCYNLNPTRSFGPARTSPLSSASPNLVEGRELWQPYGVAFDTTSSPPIVYVVDAGNNRVLGWKMGSNFVTGATADIVIGQRDQYSTLPQGPSATPPFGSGLNTPIAVAVDAAGNVWVADGGNNRILRYPKPAAQADTPAADIVIGQASIGSGTTANRGGAVGANTLYYGTAGNATGGAIAFDPQGNLWATDYGNNRVLRFPAASLTPNSDISADFVLGQQQLTTNAVPTGTNATFYNKTAVVGPLGLAISPSGAVYVADSYRRVLYFGNSLQFMGQQAVRILGIIQKTTSDPNPPALNGCPSSGTTGCDVRLGTASAPPIGLATIGESLYVADYGNNRIVRYAPPAQWQPECPFVPGTTAFCTAGTSISPVPAGYLGQTSGLETKADRGQRNPYVDSLAGPWAVAAGPNGELWVADSGNNRVVVFPTPASTGSSADPNRILGQLNSTMGAANLIQGRELYIIGLIPGTNILVSGMAVVDSQNHLFIADTFNHRILGFNDYRNVKAGAMADIVIGQPDMIHANPNYASSDPTIPSAATLYYPTGLAVDANNALWVADTINGRVLRFPNPFAQQSPIKADLVLGKAFFTVAAQNQSDVNRVTMRAPYRLAFASDGSLAVSDFSFNRILIFRKPSSGDFINGNSADIVIGQSDFVSSSPGGSTANLSLPRGVAFDQFDRLYVADESNSRLLIFPRLSDLANGKAANFNKSFAGIQGVAVSKNTGEIWVTNTGANTVLRYPVYESLTLNPDAAPLGTLPAAKPSAIGLDPFDNPIVTDLYNRVAFFYPAATFQNSASFANDLSGSALTPGMLALLYRYASPTFTDPGNLVQSNTIPVPVTLADIQVTVNGIPAPIYRVMADRIDFWVPWGAPTSGTAEVVASRVSTGEVLASAIIPMNVAAPAFYTAAQNGTGQVSAYNIRAADGTTYGVNSSSNPVAVGDYVAIFGTGIGPVPNAPADGQLSGSAPAPAPPTVTVNAKVLNAGDIGYFGLAPNLVGLFQLNIRIPQGTPPGPAILVGMIYRDMPSTTGPVVGGKIQNLRTTIAVR